MKRKTWCWGNIKEFSKGQKKPQQMLVGCPEEKEANGFL